MVMEHTQNTAKKMGNLVKDTWVSKFFKLNLEVSKSRKQIMVSSILPKLKICPKCMKNKEIFDEKKREKVYQLLRGLGFS